jgi:hypothetical protein
MIETGMILVGVSLLVAVYVTGLMVRRLARMPVAVRARNKRRG